MDLKDYREEIDGIDEKIIELFSQRMKLSAEISEYKRKNGLPVLDKNRENEILAKAAESGEYCERLYERILELSKENMKRENDS